MGDSGEARPIPAVPQRYGGILGNIPDLEPSFPAKAFWRLSELYGPIVQLEVSGGQKLIILSDYEMVNAALDDDNYEKAILTGLAQLRPFLADALFTAYPPEPNWHKAHRILMPVFGPLAVRKMFDQQLDIASQLVLHWDRFGPDHEIQTSDDFTRLAFDTIAIAAFNHRFNNFYTEAVHPFLTEMTNVLSEGGARAQRTKLQTKMMFMTAEKFDRDIKSMHTLCDEIIAERIKNPQPEINDLLNVMLNTKDPETGETLDHENIRLQMATFLVAGHETTSGTLSFLFYHLLHNPETYHKVQLEVDEIVGSDNITVDHIPKLKYIAAAIKETLRFQGPIAMISRKAKGKTRHAAKYDIDETMGLILNLRGLHHDPKIWGDDHGDFKPERMLDMSKYPAGCWKPFGVGIRSCIGRAFAEQEMVLVVALIIQRFQVTMVDPAYNLELKSTLTVKPLDFKIKAKRRPGISDLAGLGGPSKTTKKTDTAAPTDGPTDHTKHLTIMYGSNAGTCKSYAEEIASDAEQRGISAEVMTLDSAIEHETNGPVVIVTPSYEGKPADNAKKFVSWLVANKDKSELLKGRKYALFGVGNSEWASTFHKVPKLVDELMPKLGATRAHETGFVDVRGDAIGPFEAWREGLIESLFGESAQEAAPARELKVELVTNSGDQGLTDVQPSLLNVKVNKPLSDAAVGPQKMHLEVTLPQSMYYRSGDYLAVYPLNHENVVQRVLRYFNLKAGQYIRVGETKKSFLQTKIPITASDFFTSRVELYTPVTQRQLTKIADLATDPSEKSKLQDLASEEKYQSEVLRKRFSVLDILEDYTSVKVSLGAYLNTLKQLTPRQYSISSSPLSSLQDDDSLTASITYDVHEGPAWSDPHRTFHGVASTYLANLHPGDRLRAHIRPTNGAFHLPTNSETPCVFVAAGTGLAPMRAFLQERAAQHHAGGKKLGPSLLYFGCRDYNSDYIYRDELAEYEKLGIVSLRPAFSKNGDPSQENTYKYTGDRLYADREEVSELFNGGAKIFVCGSASKIAKSTAEACKKMYREKEEGRSEEDANKWFEEMREVRYVSDVYG